jgi:hypothetical protein
MPTTRDNDEERSARIDRLVEQPRTQNANAEMRRGLPSREGDVMPARTTPEDGDIVVRQKSGKPSVYVLGIPSAPAQFQVRTRDEAVAQALAFAKRQQVRAWFTKGDDEFVLLGTFREEQVESARSS